MPNPFSDCIGKEAFDDFELAQRAAKRRRGRSVYRCKICSRYHVGSSLHIPRKPYKRPSPGRLG